MFISLMEHFVTVKEEQTTFAGDFYFYLLTLLLRGQKYALSGGGEIFQPPLLGNGIFWFQK